MNKKGENSMGMHKESNDRSMKVCGLHFRKWLAALLAMVMIWSLVSWGPAANRALGAPAGDLAHEDFESTVAGSRPSAGWTFPGSTPAGVTASVYAEASGNHVLKIVQTATLSGNYGPRFSLAQAITRAELSYRVKADQTSGFIYLPRFTYTGVNLAGLGMDDKGSFVVSEGSGWKAVKSYEANRWYEVRLVIDTDADKYDLYIDNECVVTQRNTDNTTGLIQHVDLGLWRSSVGTFSIDDLNIHSFKEAVSASLSSSAYHMQVEESLPLQLVFTPADASVQTAAWSSSDPAVATVNEKGIVFGVSGGMAQITAAPYAAGLTPVTAAVYVNGAPPGTINLSVYNVQLATGGRSFLSAELLPSNAFDKRVSWTTSDQNVATVSASGEIRGAGAGIAVVTARSVADPSLQAECVVTVTPSSVPASGDLLSEDFETTAIGTKPGSGWGYGSSSPAVVSIKAAAAGAGETSRVLAFTQSAQANYSYGITRVLDAPDVDKAVLTYRIRAKQTNGFIYIPRLTSASGDIVNLGMSNEGSFSYWDISSGTGKWASVKGYEPGRWYEVTQVLDTTTGKFDLYIDRELMASQRSVTYTSRKIHQVNMGFYKECIGSFDVDDLNVYTFKEAESASFGQQEYMVPLKGSAKLQLAFVPADAALQSAVWSSDRPEVATVDETGKVSGVSAGSARITAAPIAAGLSAVTTTVHVVEVQPQSVVMAASSLQLPAGSTGYLSATVLPEETANKNVVWSSSNPTVAEVREGEVTAISAGTAVITASAQANNTIYATAAVEVMPRSVQQEFYVSPEGNDANPGTKLLPFRTMAKAQEAVRGMNDNMTGDIIVYLREGTYKLQSAWNLTEEDSGSNGYVVSWSAYPGEHPVISGGRQITGWTLYDAAKGIYKANAGMDFASRQLFIDDVRATRARSEGGLTNAAKTAVGYTSDDLALAGFARPQDLELVYMEMWTNPRAAVASVTASNGKAVITMDEPGWSAVTNKGGTSATYPVYYENAYELLDQEGEWYWNAGTGEIFYKPRLWEDMQTATVTAPVLEELVNIKGSAVDRQVSAIQFTGLTFADTTWMQPSTNLGLSDAQNNHLRYPGTPDSLPPAAVTVAHAQGIRFERNIFTRLGITGLKMVNGVQNSPIRGNMFYDISGSAISIGDPYTSAANANPTDPLMQMRNNDVLNNYIHDVAVEYMSAAAISAGFPLDMDISYNEIFNIPYSGMHIGYGWATRFPNTLRNMKVEHNFIHDLMGKGIYDGGAIYTLGNSGGSADQYNLISKNYIRNQMNEYGALYTDEGSTYWQLDRNVVDLSETPMWKNGGAKWALGNTNQDVLFTGNYTTTGYRVSNNPYSNVVETGTQLYPDAAWPSEAVDIIRQSGLTEDYGDLRAGVVERLKAPTDLVLQAGHSSRLTIAAADGKDRAVDASGLRIYYNVEDPAVATVEPDGTVTGHSSGITKAHLYVLDGTLLRTFISSIFVDEYLASVGLEELDKATELHLMKDEPQSFPIVGYTNLGRTVQLDGIVYAGSDPDLLAADADGRLTAKLAGEYRVTVTGTWNGASLTREFKVKAAEEGVAEPRALRGELADIDGWFVDASGAKLPGSDGQSITLSSSKQFALYQGHAFLNELLDFGMTINASSGWPSIMFRSQSPVKGIDDTTYILTIKPDVLELQRFNGGARTVIFGSIAGSPSLGGPALPNTMLPYNQRHRIQLGAVNEAGGVRLLVFANGQKVFDYLDTDSNAIRGAGYLGVYARSGSITLEQNGLPDLYLDAPHSVTVGDAFQVQAGLRHVAGSLQGGAAGVDFRLCYDGNALDWLGYEGAETVSAQVYSPEPGLLDIHMEAKDAQGIRGDGDWLKLSFAGLQASGGTRFEVLEPLMTDTQEQTYSLLPASAPLRLVGRELSSNADLSGLALSEGVLVPGFDAATGSYSTRVGSGTASVAVTATVYDAAASLSINGAAAVSGAAVPAALSVGSNVIQAIVTAEDGTVKAYTINVVRESAVPASPPAESDPPEGTTNNNGTVVSKTNPDPSGRSVVQVTAEELASALNQPSGGNVIIDVQTPSAPSGIAVRLPAPALRNGLAGGAAETVTVQTALARIVFSADFLARLAEESNPDVIELSVSAVAAAELPESVRSRIGSRQVYDFLLSADGLPVRGLSGNKSVAVELDYVLKPGENPDKIVVYYLNEQGLLQAVKTSSYDQAAQRLTFYPKHFSQYVGMEAGVGFTDLGTVPWAEGLILNLAAREIVHGAAEGEFRPEAAITRAEFVKLLAEALELDTAAGQGGAGFSDEAEGAWYSKYLAAARAAGIISGRDDGSFGADDPVTREDMAVLSHRFLRHVGAALREQGTPVSFTDQSDISGYASEAVAYLTGAGVVNGLEEGKFAPQAKATRAQAAAILYRILHSIE